MNKLTKKTFLPDLTVEVILKDINFAGCVYNTLEAWKVDDPKDLDLKGKEIIIPPRTKLITIKMQNWGGSQRVLFQIRGEIFEHQPTVYQTFWTNFANLTRL